MRMTPAACLALAGVVGSAGAARAQQTTRCAAAEDGGVTGVVRGRVTDVETRVPLRGASVVLSWRESGARRSRTLEAESDTAGVFTFCGAPVGERLMVRARFAGESSRGEAVEVGAAGEADVEIAVDAPHARILGRVLEARTGRPIAAATIELRGTPLRHVTVEDGRFTFPAVPPGGYDMIVSHIGYRAVRDSVRLLFGTNMEVTIQLGPDAVAHTPIEVVVRSLALERNGFYERQQRGFGDYITRETIDARSPGRASDLLTGLPGVRLVPRTGGFGSIPVGRGECPFRYVLNGSRVGPGFEIDDITPGWIEAIEIYRGIATIPSQFVPLTGEYRANCGLIIIWTRSGS